MKLVGFGCSFTFGSELLDPSLKDNQDFYYLNKKYRENKVWLGQLAKYFDAQWITYLKQQIVTIQ